MDARIGPLESYSSGLWFGMFGFRKSTIGLIEKYCLIEIKGTIFNMLTPRAWSERATPKPAQSCSTWGATPAPQTPRVEIIRMAPALALKIGGVSLRLRASILLILGGPKPPGWK